MHFLSGIHPFLKDEDLADRSVGQQEKFANIINPNRQLYALQTSALAL
jgi:hypothetical protein